MPVVISGWTVHLVGIAAKRYCAGNSRGHKALKKRIGEKIDDTWREENPHFQRLDPARSASGVQYLMLFLDGRVAVIEVFDRDRRIDILSIRSA